MTSRATERSPLHWVPEDMLRAWAESGIISHGRFVEEMKCRRDEEAEQLPLRITAIDHLGTARP